MKSIKTILISAISLYLALFVSCLYANQITGKVIKVSDGDTIKILTKSNKTCTIRLYGIDCPEKSQPYGGQAKIFLSKLIFMKKVSVEFQKKGIYGRIIGKVYINNKYVNRMLVKNGLAWHYKKYSNDLDLSAAEGYAKSNKLGLWNETDPIAPWRWRKMSKQRNNNPNISDVTKYSMQSKNNMIDMYKLNTRSNIRHNSKCRYYNKKKYAKCSSKKGRPCKICGG